MMRRHGDLMILIIIELLKGERRVQVSTHGHAHNIPTEYHSIYPRRFDPLEALNCSISALFIPLNHIHHRRPVKDTKTKSVKNELPHSYDTSIQKQKVNHQQN